MNKQIRSAFWPSLKSRSADRETNTRALIEHSAEKYSIDIRNYDYNAFVDGKGKPLDKSIIEIEMPNGNTWVGTILELQELLTPKNP